MSDSYLKKKKVDLYVGCLRYVCRIIFWELGNECFSLHDEFSQ